MNSIFGVFYRDSDYLPEIARESILNVLNGCDIGNCHLYQGDGIGLVQSFSRKLPDVRTDIKSYTATTSENFIFIAAGRLDNAADLCSCLNIPVSERHALSDFDVMRLAYGRWGKDCSMHTFGDWVFAAWHPVERHLILSRSHYGSVPIYYHIDEKILAFATSRQVLLSLKLVPIELDELWFAQFLIAWPAYRGERTPQKSIKCLPPANYLVASQNSCHTCRYWFPEETRELILSHREEYVEVFRSIFDEAVRCRLRSDKPISATLSGGLDSSLVVATASKILMTQGQRLTAFTSVPCNDTERYVSSRFGDELPYAKATANYAGNIDLHPLISTGISPIKTIRQVLQQGGVPCHGAGNLYWLMDIQKSSIALGSNVLLTGAAGNASVSWTGDMFSQPLSFLLSHVDVKTLIRAYVNRTKQKLKSVLPISLLAALQRIRMDSMGYKEWYRGSAIRPDFARHLRLLEQRLNDPDERADLCPKDKRSQILMLGKSVFGSYATEIGAMNGLELRDPTADARVIDFVLSVPDRVFMDANTGIDRWLIREAMNGRVPDEVRLNRNRGRQAGDLVLRLRACADEMEHALNELEAGQAEKFVDVAYMRQVWRMVQTEDTHEAFIKSNTILTRGLMVGLFVNLCSE